MAEEVDGTNTAANSNSKRKRNVPKGHEITTKMIRSLPFSYACLEIISDSASQVQLDEITVRSHLTEAFTQFLGLSGSAISVDILKVDGSECWIRVPREDLSPSLAAVAVWIGGNDANGKVGWRVKGKGNWLSSLVGNHSVEKIWND